MSCVEIIRARARHAHPNERHTCVHTFYVCRLQPPDHMCEQQHSKGVFWVQMDRPHGGYVYTKIPLAKRHFPLILYIYAWNEGTGIGVVSWMSDDYANTQREVQKKIANENLVSSTLSCLKPNNDDGIMHSSAASPLPRRTNKCMSLVYIVYMLQLQAYIWRPHSCSLCDATVIYCCADDVS